MTRRMLGSSSQMRMRVAEAMAAAGLTYEDNIYDPAADGFITEDIYHELVKNDPAKIVVAFNPEFVMAPLRNLDQDEVFIDLIDESSPGVIKIDEPFLYVIMPMRVAN